MDTHRRVDTGRCAAILITILALALVVFSLATPPTAQAKTQATAAVAAKAKKPWKRVEPSRACARAESYVQNHPNGKWVKQARKFILNHCKTVDPQDETPEILSVTSEASCSATIRGTSIDVFEYINMDFDSLIQTPMGYSSFLRVYAPGDPINDDYDTTVSMTVIGEAAEIVIYNPATCGKSMIVTSMLFGDNTGTAWYETVQIMA